nr:MAG TPA: hypothetical protein [Caudoviricetes sp.]
MKWLFRKITNLLLFQRYRRRFRIYRYRGKHLNLQLPVYTALCGVPSEGGTCKHWNNIEQSAVRVGKDRREISHK